jgi:membrane protein
MAAALSYYTTFSLAPLLILAISIAGLLLGHDAAQGKIMDQIGGLVGPKSAAAIQDMLKGVGSRPAQGIVSSIIGIITLCRCHRRALGTEECTQYNLAYPGDKQR